MCGSWTDKGGQSFEDNNFIDEAIENTGQPTKMNTSKKLKLTTYIRQKSDDSEWNMRNGGWLI